MASAQHEYAASQVLCRIQARDEQRRAEEASRRQEIDVDVKSARAFLEAFEQRRAEAERLISAGRTKAEEAPTVLEDLEQRLASSAYLLLPYDLRRATAALDALRQGLSACAQRQEPRKKFSFANKALEAAPAAAQSPRPVTSFQPCPREVGTAQTSAETVPTGTTFAHESDTTIMFVARDEEDVTLSDLCNCTVRLVGHLSALFMHRLQNCVVIVAGGSVHGAIHAEALQSCRIYAVARQVRLHTSQSCDFYLAVASGPIIEHSHGLGFAPYLQAHTDGLDEECPQGEWARVHDFGWLRTSASPNWSIIPETERLGPPLTDHQQVGELRCQHS